ncbi:MAG: serine/threonine-protein kinase [Acidobacteria bacterium]|nr:serine/threonine-protein kinase [Acidobacteriota bacterium]
MIGAKIGSYTVKELVGEGGMGRVYRGVDTMVSRDVAIKALHPYLSADKELVERFRAEATTMAKLQHSSICQLYALLQEDEQFFMIMEFVDGETLEARLKRTGRQDLNQALQIVAGILEAFHYAHGRGVIHRDIKPANIMITAEGAVKIMDFGIARVMGTSRMTMTGRLVGTPSYMSPEQITGGSIDARSDVYSLGIVLFQMLTGEVPFRRTSDFAVLQAQVLEQPPSPREIVGNVPVAVEGLLLKAMAKLPADRFQNAAEFLDAILEHAPGARAGAAGTQRHRAFDASAVPTPVPDGPAAPVPELPFTRMMETPPRSYTAAPASPARGNRRYLIIAVALLVIAAAGWFVVDSRRAAEAEARSERQKIERIHREQEEARLREQQALEQKAAADKQAADELKQSEEAASQRRAEAERRAAAAREEIRKKLRSQ